MVGLIKAPASLKTVCTFSSFPGGELSSWTAESTVVSLALELPRLELFPLSEDLTEFWPNSLSFFRFFGVTSVAFPGGVTLCFLAFSVLLPSTCGTASFPNSWTLSSLASFSSWTVDFTLRFQFRKWNAFMVFCSSALRFPSRMAL